MLATSPQSPAKKNEERRAVFAKINLLDKPQFINEILSKRHISGIIYVCFRIY